MNAEQIISMSAVGSYKEGLKPLDIMLPDQFVDRTNQARKTTFFGDGIVAHISFAEPVCTELRNTIYNAGKDLGLTIHNKGTYLNMEGPAFSTKAESRLFKGWGMDIIGMTNMPEARLAREAEICFATVAFITDYDCWHEDEEDVSVSSVLDNLEANAELAGRIVRGALRTLPRDHGACDCGEALRHGLITAREAVPRELVERLKPILGKYFSR